MEEVERKTRNKIGVTKLIKWRDINPFYGFGKGFVHDENH
jgi:hypothetical protein